MDSIFLQGLNIYYVNYNYSTLYLGTCPINRKLPLRFVTANMTGNALWQTFANHAEADDKDQGSMPEPVSCKQFADAMMLKI